MNDFDKKPDFGSSKTFEDGQNRGETIKRNMELELSYLKEHDPKKYEEARKEYEEFNRQINSDEFKQSMAGLASFFQGLSQGFNNIPRDLSESDKRDLSGFKAEAVNPFIEHNYEVDLDPHIISFLFSLDAKGYDDYNINKIEPINENPTDKKQWNILTNPFKGIPAVYNNLFKELFRLDEDTQDFYK